MMDDLISRQEATTIPILPKEHRQYQTMNIDDAYDLGWLDCQNCIEKLPSAQSEIMRWIPVSERLPEKKTEVIYSLENHYVSTGYMTDRDYTGNTVELHWEDNESGVLIYPEAWMPLPKPYKEDKNE